MSNSIIVTSLQMFKVEPSLVVFVGFALFYYYFTIVEVKSAPLVGTVTPAITGRLR
jgi:hypothetical protein